MELIEILEKIRKLKTESEGYLLRLKAAEREFERIKQEMSDYNREDKKMYDEHLIKISKYRERVTSLVERSSE